MVSLRLPRRSGRSYWGASAARRKIRSVGKTMNRRVAMLGFFVLVVLAGWPISSFGESSIRIVDNGRPVAGIVISKDFF